MSEKSGEMPSEVKAKMNIVRHQWRAWSTDDDGEYTERPDDVFEQGFEACYLFMSEREARLKAQLDLAKQHIAFLAVKDGLNNDCTKSYSNGFEDARAAAHRLLQDIKWVIDDVR